MGGVLELSAIGFSSFLDTTSIVAGTFTFHYYDEINGSAPFVLTSPIAATDASAAFGSALAQGTFVQIDQEILQVTGTNADGSLAIARGMHGTTAAAHIAGALAYSLTDKVAIVPFGPELFWQPGERRLEV